MSGGAAAGARAQSEGSARVGPKVKYQSVKVPAEAHNRARFLSGALGMNIGAVYAAAIELLWRRTKRARDRALRRFEPADRP